MFPVVPFKNPRAMGAPSRGGFAFTRTARRNAGGMAGLHGLGTLAKLGNMSVGGLADYINSPGLPGSSTFWLYGLNDDGTADSSAPASDFWASAAQSVTDIFKAGAQAYTAVQVANINAQRAQQQLPPINTYGQVINPATGQPVATSSRMTPVLLIAGAGLAALLLLRRR